MKEKEYFVKRLHIIEGQIRGVANMINDERNCEEVLMQMGALTNSLRGLSKDYLKNYMQKTLGNKNKKEVDEIVNLFNKLV